MSRACTPSPRAGRLPSLRLAMVLAFAAGLAAALTSWNARAWNASRSRQNVSAHIEWQGRQRYFIVHEPRRIDRPLPVVVMLHGFAGTAEWSLRYSGWAEKADAEGFLAVFPEGSRPDHSRPSNYDDNCPAWNDGSGRFTACWENVDDVGFLRATVEAIARRYPIDRRRVYIAGFSNGSSLAYRAALEAPGVFAAVGAMSSSGIRVPLQPLEQPVSLIAMHGAQDPMSPLEGGAIPQFGKIDVRPPVVAAPYAWAQLLGLTQWQRGEGDDYIIERAGPGPRGEEVRFYVLFGRGHLWPRSRTVRTSAGEIHDQIDAADLMWDFFKSKSLPEPRAAAKAEQ
jgi:polyhydroxybutyrate depolymerase